MEFNVRHALLIAIGLNRNCREIIDKIYSENEQEYYSLYINSEFFNDLLKNIFTIKTQESINKLIGIIEYCYKENNFTKLESLIKIVHPSILKYVKTANIVNIDTFNDKYLKDKVDLMSEVEIFTILICLIYTGTLYKKDMIGGSASQLAFRYWKKLTQTVITHNNRFKLTEKKLNNYRKEIGKNYFIFNLEPYEKIKEDKLSLFLENYIENYVSKECTDNTTFEEYLEFRGKSFTEGIIKYIGSFSRLLNTFGLEEMDSSVDIKFNNEIFNMILLDFSMGKIENNINEGEKGLYIIASLYIYNLVELYNEAKELYLNKSKEEKYTNLKKYEEKLIEDKQILKDKELKYKKELQDKDEEANELKRKIKDLEKDINKTLGIELRINKVIEEKDNEINSLKEENTLLIKTITELNNLKVVSNVEPEEMAEYINNFKIGIFGGKKSIKGLSEILKNVTYYEALTQDITSIKNLDYIFINTDFFNHAFSKKVISYKNKFNTPFGYIGGTNKNLILNQMYKYLKNC